MIEPFIIRALAAGIGVALVAGALGCFVLWRRMAYFGDSISHSALLGVALGILFNLNINFALIVICMLFAALLAWLQQNKLFAIDTLMGIVAHAALSVGLLALAAADQDIELHDYLFGDILAVTATDLWLIFVGGALTITLLVVNWHSLILMIVDEDLAVSEGVNLFYANILLMSLVAIAVAVTVKVVGVLLIISLLIIPAATARPFSSSPVSMVCFSAMFGVLAIIIGVIGAVFFEMPAGPSIVGVATLFFAVLFPFSMRRQ